MAVSKDYLLHHKQQRKIAPTPSKPAPDAYRGVALLPLAYIPANIIAAPPPKNESNKRATAHIARHLAQLLISHMKTTDKIIPVNRIIIIVFHVAVTSVTVFPASLSKNYYFKSFTLAANLASSVLGMQ